jgi:hypothetical protein
LRDPLAPDKKKGARLAPRRPLSIFASAIFRRSGPTKTSSAKLLEARLDFALRVVRSVSPDLLPQADSPFGVGLNSPRLVSL